MKKKQTGIYTQTLFSIITRVQLSIIHSDQNFKTGLRNFLYANIYGFKIQY